jgi:hypothetical protein
MDKRGALALEIPQAFPYRDTEVRRPVISSGLGLMLTYKAITTPMPISRNAIVTVRKISTLDGA